MNKYQSYKPSGVEWIGEIPEHWETIRFGMLGIFSSSGIDKKLDDNETSVRMVNYTDIIKSRVHNPIINNQIDFMVVTTPQSKLEEHKLRKGDLVFLPSSETCEDLGVSSLIDFDENDIVYSYHILRFKFLKEVNHYFKKYIGNHNGVYNQFSLEGKGTTRQIIGRNVFRNVKVVLPPISEQLQIVQFLDSKTELIDNLIKSIEKRIELLKEKRLGLIQKVILNNEIERIRLKYVVDLINRPITEFDSTNYTRIGMYNWGRGIFKYEEEIGSELGDSEFSIIKEGDLILSGQFSWEGSVSIVESEFDNCICSHRFHILKGKNNVLLNEYLWGYFTSQEGHFILDINSNGFAGRNRPLNIGKLLKEKIPIPNLNIQNEIKNIVEIERKNNEYSQKMKSLLKEYRQSLISEVVTGKIKVTTDE